MWKCGAVVGLQAGGEFDFFEHAPGEESGEAFMTITAAQKKGPFAVAKKRDVDGELLGMAFFMFVVLYRRKKFAEEMANLAA